MKQLSVVITALLLLSNLLLFSQKNYSKCGVVEHTQRLIEQRPEYALQLQQAEQQIQNWLATYQPPNGSNRATQDTICVVVHVVYTTNQQNISDAQVFSQIDVMNQDFARENPDTINTPVPFQTIAGALPYHFQLARRDPFNNPTNGIDRRQTTVTSFTTDDKVKANSTGGLDSWDVTTYLNIWVCNLTGGLLGYGEFPAGTPSNTFGLAVDYQAFGTFGTAVAPNDGGRTTTHEISHCFDLYHIWGDDGGACTGSDAVGDTPNQADATSGCYTFPHTDACTTTGNGIMYMNYMDYSDDACMNMFTQGQVNRMNAGINNFYPGIVNSIGLQPTVPSVDAGISKIISPNGNSCSAQVNPAVELKCFGSIPLTQVNILYRIDNGPLETYTWTGSMTTGQTAIISTLNFSSTTNGQHILQAFTSNPNGLTGDNSTANDTASVSFVVFLTGLPLPYNEGFEDTTFPSHQITFGNEDGGETWIRYTTAKHSGIACTRLSNFLYDAGGTYDDLILPNLNLATMTNPRINYARAYTYYDNTATQNDSLQIMLSADCGVTWNTLFYSGGDDLKTANPSTNSWRPANETQWAHDTLDLAPWANEQNVIIKFRNIGYYQNNLYLDDVNVLGDSAVVIINGVNEMASGSISVYPNPATSQINIDWQNSSLQIKNIEVLNVVGEKIWEKKSFSSKLISIDVSRWSKGVYFIKSNTSSGIISKRIIIQ